MTVEQNVAYGLKVRKVPKAERLQQAREALADVRLEGFGARRPPSSPAVSVSASHSPAPSSGAPGAAPRRAARRPRPQAARADAGRTQGDPARGRHHLRLRHPRPGGGPDDERPHRRLQPGPYRADRHAGRDLRTPRHPFVAGFVGTSNLLEGDSAQQVVGASGTYSIRPEKIRVLKESAEADEPEHSTATGTVVEVVYLGDATRFLVDLDAGGRLTALQQNLETSSEDVAAYRGTRVRLGGTTVTASRSPPPLTTPRSVPITYGVRRAPQPNPPHLSSLVHRRRGAPRRDRLRVVRLGRLLGHRPQPPTSRRSRSWARPRDRSTWSPGPGMSRTAPTTPRSTG